MRRQLVPALGTVIVLTVACGLLYPLIVTGVARIAFPGAASGSLVEIDGRVVRSAQLGQPFSLPEHFWPRPSAAGGGYDGAASAASNLGPTSDELRDAVARRVVDYRVANGLPDDVAVPVDAVTASGSGLDPDISVENARLQAPRVARARAMSVERVDSLIDDHIRGRDLGMLGETRVNVLELNRALDASG